MCPPTAAGSLRQHVSGGAEGSRQRAEGQSTSVSRGLEKCPSLRLMVCHPTERDGAGEARASPRGECGSSLGLLNIMEMVEVRSLA